MNYFTHLATLLLFSLRWAGSLLLCIEVCLLVLARVRSEAQSTKDVLKRRDSSPKIESPFAVFMQEWAERQGVK